MIDADRAVRMRRSFRALFEIAKALAADLTLEDLLRQVAREACTLVEATACSIMLFDQSRKRLLTAAAHGLTVAEEREISFALGEGVAGWVAEHGTPARIADVMKDPRFVVSPRQAIAIRAMLCVALRVQDETIGVITLTHESRPYDDEDEEMLLILADTIVLEIELARMRRMAYTDALTGALSRLGLDAALAREIDRARRDSASLAVVLCDVDRFKRVNDERGHQAGDALLVALTARLRASVRYRDAIFRYGGEEFLVLAPGITLARARAIAERIRRSVADTAFEPGGGAPCQVTLSCGVAVLRDDDSADGASLVSRADQALLAAKRSGRNRVSVQGA
ncbi:MAG TPA: sensor domain-containing diguanylate cyclase [Myxococcota bacterium]|jgi:diguanylate cyclase (GGDEF)-like protein|nr:sensor domain-containing diguanylate cyclase [Myxococcota bacterium]